MAKKETKKKTATKKTVAKKATAKKSVKKNTTTLKKTSQTSTTTANKKTKKSPALPKLSKEKKQIKLSHLDRDKELLQIIIEGMQEKKARNITVLNLQDIENSFCNYFVICEADSRPQLQAITDSIEGFTTKKLKIKPHHIEGVQNAEWILLDG
jgi:ribosome-associated protein